MLPTRSCPPPTTARRHGRRATGRRPTGSGPRSRPPAGRSSTAAPTSRSSRPHAADGRGRRAPSATARATAVPSRLGRSRPPASRPCSSSRPTGRTTSSARSPRVRAHAPAGTSVVVVADGPSAEQAAGARRPTRLERRRGRPDERAARPGAALNVGLRRASGPVVVVLDPIVEPTGDVVTPLVAGARRPDGRRRRAGSGIVSDDLRRFEDARPGRRRPRSRATRWRSGAQTRATRGPLDERFRFYRNLDIWWSLVLRDEGEGTAPRRAVAVPSCPRPATSTAAGRASPTTERDRLSKRNFYRIIDRFGARRDLATGPVDAVRRAAESSSRPGRRRRPSPELGELAPERVGPARSRARPGRASPARRAAPRHSAGTSRLTGSGAAVQTGRGPARGRSRRRGRASAARRRQIAPGASRGRPRAPSAGRGRRRARRRSGRGARGPPATAEPSARGRGRDRHAGALAVAVARDPVGRPDRPSRRGAGPEDGAAPPTARRPAAGRARAAARGARRARRPPPPATRRVYSSLWR